MAREVRRGEYAISTDKSRIDLDVVRGFLSSSYWAHGIPEEVVRRSIDNALVFGVFRDDQQVGFARVITDFATFAYISDVFVVPECQGSGLGTWLVETIMGHPDLTGLRRWMLATRDAHGLYRKFGFSELSQPGWWMERKISNPYDSS